MSNSSSCQETSIFLRIWSPRYKHQKVDLDRRDAPQSVADEKDDDDDDGAKKSVSTVNCNKSVIDQCFSNGFTLHHIPRNSGRNDGGVGVPVNNRNLAKYTSFAFKSIR